MAQIRRRGDVLEQAILHAAVDELVESGYPGLTMDRVAKRAGTNKNTIYRRWPHRAALGVAAYRVLLDRELHVPDTGDLRTDVLTVLRQMNRDLATPKADIIRGLMASAAEEPELQAEIQQFVADGGSAMWLTILDRAAARGEVRPAALTPRVATVAVVQLRNEYVVHGMHSVPDEVIVAIVDEVYLPLVTTRQ